MEEPKVLCLVKGKAASLSSRAQLKATAMQVRGRGVGV